MFRNLKSFLRVRYAKFIYYIQCESKDIYIYIYVQQNEERELLDDEGGCRVCAVRQEGSFAVSWDRCALVSLEERERQAVNELDGPKSLGESGLDIVRPTHVDERVLEFLDRFVHVANENGVSGDLLFVLNELVEQEFGNEFGVFVRERTEDGEGLLVVTDVVCPAVVSSLLLLFELGDLVVQKVELDGDDVDAVVHVLRGGGGVGWAEAQELAAFAEELGLFGG